ncbi:hypothetical protein [Nevskia sp.]|uniref:hypothetical protein n=1 Tax=Nevskia sp. TaxID=1929292 RepID=UPI0025D9CDE8|nr:hypothetical protein [Nevskia sp.]
MVQEHTHDDAHDHGPSGTPPLPELIANTDTTRLVAPSAPVAVHPGVITPIPTRSLRCGCYLINFKPSAGSALVTYDGTLRVECHAEGRTASGDLYQRGIRAMRLGTGQTVISLQPPPNPAAGIPIFARGQYREYLRVTSLLENFTFGSNFTLGFERRRFDSVSRTWSNLGAFTALMTWMAAPAGYPSSKDYLSGIVKNASNVAVGTLTMGWVSKYLRKVTVEIDRVSVSEAPLNDGGSNSWASVFEAINWQGTVDVSDANIAQPSGESWSDAEMHQTMLAKRDASNLDAEWRYHVLAVRRLDSTERGIMYDGNGSDSNNVPREGVGISSHWVIPNAAPWGLAKGQRFGASSKAYFRTAVHELGHAFGLYHNSVDLGFMNVTPSIAAAATASNPFPNNIQWSFATDDLMRLRHFPDIYVRPGGTPFGTSYASTPQSPRDSVISDDSLHLKTSALLDVVPLGAPVRINLELVNTGDAPVAVPGHLSMKGGTLRGQVIDPAGNARQFSSCLVCLDDESETDLAPGKSVRSALTLMRGPQGALFGSAGLHRVQVDACWESDGNAKQVSGETAVMITPPVDDAHARAALKVLSTPDTLLVLVFGGDHLTDGLEAVQAALDNPVLRPHYAYIEAKRLGQRFGKRKADARKAAALITTKTVMTDSESKKAKLLMADAGDEAAAGKTAGRKTGA